MGHTYISLAKTRQGVTEYKTFPTIQMGREERVFGNLEVPFQVLFSLHVYGQKYNAIGSMRASKS